MNTDPAGFFQLNELQGRPVVGFKLKLAVTTNFWTMQISYIHIVT